MPGLYAGGGRVISKTDKLTPAVKRLLVEYMAKRQTERVGCNVGAIAVDIINGGLGKSSDAALEDVNTALADVRNARAPNPFANATDEEIATAILKRVEERRRERR